MLINIQEGYVGSLYEACFISADLSDCSLGQRREVQFSQTKVQHDEVNEGIRTFVLQMLSCLTAPNDTKILILKQFDIVACIAIARQRLGKHIPALANSRDNRTSIPRQRTSKNASLTTEAVFSVWSVQSGYKEVISRRPVLTSERAPHKNKTVTVKQQ
jgi:hypothetical protein